ncbi:hypothetical protein PA42_15300 [Pasteurella canis]|uniref:Uncharacterized protein n=1 Tax=Pasteurella canis TaxID=753 RepID=A0ABQ4VHL4_9PAST|nr:hypothetical protein PA42_15300 [Pasteurella canis]
MNRYERTGQNHIKESTKAPIHIYQQINFYSIEKPVSEQKTKIDSIIDLLIFAVKKIIN